MLLRPTAAILIALATISLTWYTTVTYPFGQQEKDLISIQGAPHQAITLSAGQTATQDFRTKQPLISEVSIYSTSERLTNQRIILEILSPEKQLLATSQFVRQTYRDEKLKLTFSINWLETNIGQDFIVVIRNQRGDPLQLFTTTEDTYHAGVFSVDSQPYPQLDLSLTTTQPAPTPSGVRRGVLAGLLVLAGSLIMHLIPIRHRRARWMSAGLLVVIVTPLALGGFWQSTELLGISDWDFYFSVHEVLRRSVVTQQAFPFWNPYTCGGTAGLGDPEFPLFTITFLFELLLGVPHGLRFAIFLSTATGALGMLALGKRIGLSPQAALLAAVATYFGSVNLLEIVEGHPNIFAAMWIPWIFWAWLKAYREGGALRRSLFTGVFLALTFYQGGIYLLFYTTIAFVTLIALSPKRRAAFMAALGGGLWAVGLAAVKLVPVLFWLSQFQDESYAASTTTAAHLYEILLGRHLHGATILPNQGTGWHEYGAYIGPLVLALAILGLTKISRPLVRALLLSVILALGLSSAGPLLEPLFDVLPFIPRSTISRVVLFAVLPLALLAGLGIDQLRRWSERASELVPSIIGLAAVSLMSLTYPLSQQAFVIAQDDVRLAPAPTPIAFTAKTYPTRADGIDQTRSYLPTKAGFGTLNYCTPLGPKASVIIVESEYDPSVITIENAPSGNAVELTDWSPNKVQAKATVAKETIVILNTNYAKGWQVNDQPAREVAGRVGAKVEPGVHDLTFRYRTPGFPLGLAITSATLLLAISLSLKKKWR